MTLIRSLFITLFLMLSVATPAQAGLGDTFRDLGSTLGLGSSQPEFLDPEDAFFYSAEIIDSHTIRANFDIVDDYYLYKDKFEFTIEDAEGITIVSAIGSKGKEKDDEFFGLMEVYYGKASFTINLQHTLQNETSITLVARYQGCADAGLCYPPVSSRIDLLLPASDGTTPDRVTSPLNNSAPLLSEQDQLANDLANSSVWLTIATFFGLGLLLAFTPCVFPMIPILSSIIVGQGEQITTRRAFTLSLVYVLAMALTYTIAGVFAGMFGENLQIMLQNVWVLGSFSIVFIALAMSMFGFYELQLPNALQSKISEMSSSQQKGTLVGTAIMGFLSALIVGPCVAPPLAGALIYIGQSGDALLGGMALFALSMGMGIPLLAIGASAGKLLPRAGDWMNNIKAVFGVMLLAVAIWMLERIIPASTTLALWAVLLIGSSIYLGALEPVGISGSGWKKLWKGLGLILLIYGSLLLIGAASGAKDPLQPLQGISLTASGSSSQSDKLSFKIVKSEEDLQRELAFAKQNNQPVMLDFYADWCISCKEMERYTFSDPQVKAALSGFHLLKADVTANDADDKALLRRFELIGPPSIIFYDRNGQEQRNLRLVGFMEATSFRQHAELVR
ncbi:Cytochrome c-type biogenesis protein DsbD, protein-disulfide reductase [hydrothermal vent metagenome]|uniref:Thiol:disulfide interchange protein DsbD n=1 Tax=hydrothermal vent metagenome TaxID=652676 RepID=A0A3B0Z8D7_9ZZZZ